MVKGMAFKHLPPKHSRPLPSEDELHETVRRTEEAVRKSGNGKGKTSEKTPTETPVPETVEEEEEELTTWDDQADQSAKAGGDGQANGQPDWTKDADNIELPF